MYFLSTILLGLLISPAITYKLPLRNGPPLTDDNTIDKPYNLQWEWQSQDRMDEGKFMLAHLRRVKKSPKEDVKSDEKIIPKVDPTESLYEELSDTTPNILEASSALTKAKKMPVLSKVETTPLNNLKQPTKRAELDEDETTPLTDLQHTTNGAELDEDETTPLTDLQHTTNGAELDEDETTPLSDLEHTTNRAELNEDETTPLSDLEQTTNMAKQALNDDETTQVGKSITQSQTLVTESPLKTNTSEELPVLTSKTFNKATTVSQINSKGSQDTSSPQTTTNDKLLEDITSSSSPKAPKTSSSSTSVILQDLTTEHDVTSSPPTKPSGVTYISTSLEDKVHTQSMMRQCMLAILILSVVCTIFIISTIALAAKLSSMNQKSKLRHPVAYTEMRCISSLMPDNDQQNKPKPKKLKTFASSIEESDGDNTTLNSFLPDH
ncbi:P-selectin glycoprotein ligand 1 [Ranitomeya variabilis]|uniref:P-selectin glycoprotein ligand 1 n=1 Tax=Ranitomeya variabilis TaxID=490064 RepID=UPI0040575340